LSLSPGPGTGFHTGGHTAKNVAGFDFTRLLYRSGVRLGTIDSVTLKLLPRPESKATTTVDQLEDLLTAVRRILGAGLSLSALLARNRTQDSGGEGRKGWILAAELSGSSILVDAQIRTLGALTCRQKGINGPPIIQTRPEPFWQAFDHRETDSGHQVAEGCGTRCPLFTLLEKHHHHLDNVTVTHPVVLAQHLGMK
jgi:FAD/FMN-containing dehydrogenase